MGLLAVGQIALETLEALEGARLSRIHLDWKIVFIANFTLNDRFYGRN